MTHTVKIQFFAYDPAKLTITAGDSVQWINRDSIAHTATRTDDPAFDTEDIASGATSSPQLFPNASPAEGWGYFCIPHPHMQGSIIVTSGNPKDTAAAR